MVTGDTLSAAEDLIKKFEGAQLVGSFCVFEIPTLHGRTLINHKFVSIAELATVARGNEFFDWEGPASVLGSIQYEMPLGSLAA